MPRSLTTQMLAALTSPSFSPAILVSIAFSSGTVCVWSGYGSITWNGLTFTGLGSLLSLAQIEEGSTVEARGCSVVFSGLDPTLLPDALTEIRLGLPCTIWLAAISGGSPISNPVILFSGAVDQPSVEVSAESCELTINLESILISLDVPVDQRYNQETQQALFPGDQAFQFVNSIITTRIFWGTGNTNNMPTTP